MKNKRKQYFDMAFELSRRKFNLMLGGGSLLTVAGCGGGGSDAPVPVPVPVTEAQAPPPTGSQAVISLLAGGLGGGGWLEGRGAHAHLSGLGASGAPGRAVRTPDGSLYFIALHHLCKVSVEGDVRFLGEVPDGYAGGIAADSRGTLYFCGRSLSTIYRRSGTEPLQFTAIAGPAEGLKEPHSPVFDKSDNLYFIDFGNRQIRRITPDGTLTTLAGQPAATLLDGQGNAAGFFDPSHLLLLADGNFLVVDRSRLRRMTPDGTVTTLPGTFPVEPTFDVNSLYAAREANLLYAVRGHSIVRHTVDTGVSVTIAGVAKTPGYAEGAGPAARFNFPRITIEANGELTVVDTGNDVIRRVDPASGQTSLLVGSVAQPGHVDGTGAQARFADLGPTTIDPAGNVYVLETVAKTLRKITPAGVASTLFQDFPSAGGLAVDATGNFYGVRDRTIVKVTPAGVQTVLAGQAGGPGFADGTGTAAQFATPQGLAIDLQGNLLVGDAPVIERDHFGITSTLRYGNTIRSITPAGVVSTRAGAPGRVFQFDPGRAQPNPAIEFHAPTAIALDAAGQIYVLDSRRRNIRRLGTAGADPVVIAAFDNLRTSESRFALAVTPDGTVFFAEQASVSDEDPARTKVGKLYNTIRKVVSPSSSVAVAGQEIRYGAGVTTGALPGTLNVVTGLVAAGNNKLYCCSENSVLEIRLA